MTEFFINGSIDHDSAPAQAVWRTSGQLALDLGCEGIRLDSHMSLRFEGPTITPVPEPFFQANIDRAAVLGLKVSIIVAPVSLRTAEMEALGGDWDGFIPTATNWRATRIPNTPAVNSAVIAHVLGLVGYAVDELGEENVQVEVGNEPRHVYRSGGSPSTTLTATATNATTIEVADNSGFDAMLERSDGYLIIETDPRQYARMGDFGDGTIDLQTPVTAPSGTVVRMGDSYDNDGEVDADYLAQLSEMIVAVKAAFPDVFVWAPTFWQLGNLSGAGGIATYADFFAALNPATYPGFTLADGFAFNYYTQSPAFALDSESYARTAVDGALAAIAYIRTKSTFGMNTKPLGLKECGATPSLVRMGAGVPISEVQRGKMLRKMVDLYRALPVQWFALFASRSGTADGNLGAAEDYELLDVNGNASIAVRELASTRAFPAAVAPSGYTNSGSAYLGGVSGVVPF